MAASLRPAKQCCNPEEFLDGSEQKTKSRSTKPLLTKNEQKCLEMDFPVDYDSVRAGPLSCILITMVPSLILAVAAFMALNAQDYDSAYIIGLVWCLVFSLCISNVVWTMNSLQHKTLEITKDEYCIRTKRLPLSAVPSFLLSSSDSVDYNVVELEEVTVKEIYGLRSALCKAKVENESMSKTYFPRFFIHLGNHRLGYSVEEKELEHLAQEINSCIAGITII